jgi:hypothetical protein
MNSNTDPRRTHRGLLLAGIALIALAAILLSSCGGGVGSGGTGSFGSAPVSGLGSVFVGGIEFDDSHATVLDDDGMALTASTPPVRLGMTVDVQGGDVVQGPNGPSASASTIQLARLAVGPVTSSDIAGHTLTVLGQVLQINGSTVFDAAIQGGLAGLRPGDSVSVYALADALGEPVATRIEPASPSAPSRLRGFAANVNTQARRLAIGSAQLDYSAAANTPADLATGRFVHVKISGATPSGVLQVGAFLPATRAPGEATQAVGEGVVAAPIPGVSFRLGALIVDVHGAIISPPGSVLSAGEQVQVQGRLQDGTLVADTVTVTAPEASGKRSYQLVGAPSALDATAQTFVVRGVGVDYGAAQFVNGTVALLAAPNVTVHVQGTLSPDGTRVQARTVVFP